MKNIIYSLKASLIISLVLQVSYNSFGQADKHRFSAAAGGVFSYIDYDLKNGQLSHDYGVNLGIRYSYYFSDNWSIGLGAEYQSFNSTAKLRSFSGSYMAIDNEGESFEFRYTAQGLSEDQNFKWINIPLNIQYEGSDYPSFYASVGAKVGFAVKSTFETTVEDLSTSGYYPQYDAELFNPAFMGFGNFGNVSPGRQDLDVKVAYLATVEAGVKQFEDNNHAIYIGMYLDYGLNSFLNKENKEEVVEYPGGMPVTLQYNSILDTSHTDNARLISYGVKVRLTVL